MAGVRTGQRHLCLEHRDEEESRLTTDGSDTLLNGTVSWVYWEELLNRADRGYEWAPDSSAIAYLQSDESGVGEMHYVDFEPYLPRLIKQRHPKPGEANPRVRAGVVTIADARKYMDRPRRLSLRVSAAHPVASGQQATRRADHEQAADQTRYLSRRQRDGRDDSPDA